MELLAYSIALFIPLISAALLCHYTQQCAKSIFTPEEYQMYLHNQDY